MKFNKSLCLFLLLFGCTSLSYSQRNYFIGTSLVLGNSHTPNKVESNATITLSQTRDIDERYERSFALSFGWSKKGNLNRRYILSTYKRKMGRWVHFRIPGFDERRHLGVGPVNGRHYTFAVSERRFLDKKKRISLEISPGVSLIVDPLRNRSIQETWAGPSFFVKSETGELVQFEFTRTMDYNGPVLDPFLNISTLFVYNFHGVHHLTAGFEGFIGILPQSSQTNVYVHPQYGTYRFHVRSQGHGLNFQIGYRMQIFRTKNWDLGGE